MKEVLIKIGRIISTQGLAKFIITAVAFSTWYLFFDENDYFTQRERQRDLDTLTGNIKYLTREINNMAAERESLVKNYTVIERYARENYRMKKENEDVYVIDSK